MANSRRFTVICQNDVRNHLTPVNTGWVARGRPAERLPAAWEAAIEEWAGWLKLSGLSANTIELRRGHMRTMAKRSGTSHPAQVRFADLVEVCSQQDWSKEHRRSVRTTLNKFFDWARVHEWHETNPAAQLPHVAAAEPKPRPAPDEVWRELLAKANPRERLMARLAGEAGMRRAEVARCHRDDLVRDTDGWALVVHGKGDRQRVVPIADGLAREIRDHCQAGYLFPGDIGGHLSAKYVGELLSRLMPDGFAMHSLRHRYASRGYRKTRNLRAVQMALGHKSVATTERYCLVTRDEIRRVSDAASDDDDVA